MKKGLLLLILLVIPSVIAQCPTTKELQQNKLQAQQAFFAARTEERLIPLKAILQAAVNTSEGERLTELKDEVERQEGRALEVLPQFDEKGLQGGISQAQVALTKARTIIKKSDKALIYRNAADGALQDQQAYLKDLFTEAMHQEDTYFLTAFDTLLCQYSEVVDSLDENAFDVERLQGKLDSIRLKRKNFLGALQEARDACGTIPFITCKKKRAADFLGFAQGIGKELAGIKDEIQNKGMRDAWQKKLEDAEAQLNTSIAELNKTRNSGSFPDLKAFTDKLFTQLLTAKQMADERLFNRTDEILGDVSRNTPVLQKRITDTIQELVAAGISLEVNETNANETNITGNVTGTNTTATTQPDTNTTTNSTQENTTDSTG